MSRNVVAPLNIPFPVEDSSVVLQHPQDVEVAFYVLFPVTGSTEPGVYVWVRASRHFQRVALLEDLPHDQWVRLQDPNGSLLPVELLVSAGNGLSVAGRCLPLGSILKVNYSPDGWVGPPRTVKSPDSSFAVSPLEEHHHPDMYECGFEIFMMPRPGVYIWGAWPLIAELSDIPRDRWVRFEDNYGNLIPFEMFLPSQGQLAKARWLPLQSKSESPSPSEVASPFEVGVPFQLMVESPGYQTQAYQHPLNPQLVFTVTLRAGVFFTWDLPGVYIWDYSGRQWRMIASLDDIRTGRWVQMRDPYRNPLPFELLLTKDDGLYARWLLLATDTPEQPRREESKAAGGGTQERSERPWWKRMFGG